MYMEQMTFRQGLPVCGVPRAYAGCEALAQGTWLHKREVSAPARVCKQSTRVSNSAVEQRTLFSWWPHANTTPTWSPLPSRIQVTVNLPPFSALCCLNLAAYREPLLRSPFLSATNLKNPTLSPSSVRYTVFWSGITRLCGAGGTGGRCGYVSSSWSSGRPELALSGVAHLSVHLTLTTGPLS